MKIAKPRFYSSLGSRQFSSTVRRREIRELQELPERNIPSFFETQRHDLLSLQWPGPPRNILLVKKDDTAAATDALLEFAQHLHSTYPAISCVLEPDIASALHDRLPFPVHAPPHGSPRDPSLLPRKVDLTATFGGDGTILHAASLFSTSEHVPPILAFSMGTLGFLGEWKFHEYKRAFREVYMSGAPGAGDRSSILGQARERNSGSGSRDMKTSRYISQPHKTPKDSPMIASASEIPYKPPFSPHLRSSEDQDKIQVEVPVDNSLTASASEISYKPPFTSSASTSQHQHQVQEEAPKDIPTVATGNEIPYKPPFNPFTPSTRTFNNQPPPEEEARDDSSTKATENEVPFKPPFAQSSHQRPTSNPAPTPGSSPSPPPPKWPSLPGLYLGNRPARVLLRSRLQITIRPSPTPLPGEVSPSSPHRRLSPPPPLQTLHALNDLTLHRSPSPHLTSLALSLSTPSRHLPSNRPTPLTTLHSDGLILSTPTGSTAYSLSAGGSIIHPLVSSITLTPICPRSLSFRPLVLPGDMNVHITLDAGDRSGRVMIGVDGVEVADGLEKGGTVVVTGEGLRKEALEMQEDTVTKWSGGVPCLMRGAGGGEGEADDGWVGGLNGLLKFNYPFGEEG